MRRIGILSFSSPGHFYPLTALGRRLQSRGHEVVYFQVADLPSSRSGRQACGSGKSAAMISPWAPSAREMRSLASSMASAPCAPYFAESK